MREFRGLSARKRLFINLFFAKPNEPLTTIVREAGFCAGSTDRTVQVFASRLVREPKVAEEIRRRQELNARRQGLTLERLIDELAKLAFAEMPDYADLLNADDPVAALKELPPELGAAIKSIVVSDIGEGRRKIAIELHDKLAAQKLIAGHLGLRRPLGMFGPNAGQTPALEGQRQTTMRAMLRCLSPKQIAAWTDIVATIKAAERTQNEGGPMLEHAEPEG